MSINHDDASAYEADSRESASDDNILSQITRTAAELRAAQDDVELAERNLKAAQDRVRILKESTLPDLMDRAQQKRLTTSDGYELQRSEELRASIPAANMPQAVMWLTAHGQESIIKREVKLQFGKGEDQKAAHSLEVLIAQGYAPTDRKTVHPQTLGAVVRELIAAGVDVPMQLLGVYVQPTIKMKPVKQG